MKLIFIMPRYFGFPIGGYRVHFEHANHLAQRGHSVTICLPWHGERISRVANLLKALAVCWRLRRVPNRGIKWFIFKGPELRVVPDQRSYWLPGAWDATIATGWQTAEFVSHLPKRFGQKFYSIWDYELYMSGDEAVRSRIASTYQAGLAHITATETMNRLIISLGGTAATIVDTGIDFEVFSLSNPTDAATRNRIGFCFRHEVFKRSGDAIKALEAARAIYPDLRIWSFGGARPPQLPDWVDYYERPSDRELAALYNETMIFVCSSEYEGWGLPGSEAMACGAALVSTDHGGVNAYAENNKTALIIPPCDVRALSSAVQRLIDDPALRQNLAREGASYIRRFTWKSSTGKLEEALRRGQQR